MGNFKKKYRAMQRKKIDVRNRNRLTNKQFTIISSNCWGGVVYHDLGCQFLSPTIDLWFEPQDFLKFVENLESYLELEVTEEKSTEYDYPVGKLGDIHLYFMHYKTFDDAKEKWKARLKRINWDNIFIVMTEWANSTVELYSRFERLPYKNKVLFTIDPHEDYPSTYCLKNAKGNDGAFVDIFKYKSPFSGYRYIDDFDYVSFLNQR